VSQERKWIPEMEVIRTISILLLLIHHSGIYSIPVFGVSLERLSPFFEAFLLGSFFLISGYFMEISLQNSGGNLRRFFLWRFMRIYPPYLVALLLYVFVMGITLKTRTDWLVYLGALQFIFAPEFVKPMITLWYVGAILLYYFIFPLLRRLTSGIGGLTFIACAGFLLVYMTNDLTGLFDVRFFKYYFVFFAGMIMAGTGDPARVLSAGGMMWKGALLVMGVFLFSLVAYDESNQISLPYLFASIVFILSAFIFLYSMVAKLDLRAPWRWVVAVSYASYFVYLFHRPFWEVINSAFPMQELESRILVRLLPASGVVILVCYYLQGAYDRLLHWARRKLVR
jgi:peptidoglycan/LPS O-acetylase OafA/YrhL